jgi:hypothetical protein
MIFGNPKLSILEWYKWYAWYPVRLGIVNKGRWIWLEWIEHKECISNRGHSWYIYREINKEKLNERKNT